MTVKSIKRAALAVATVAAITAGTMFASTAPSMAAGMMPAPVVNVEAPATVGSTQVHYRSYYHRHKRYKRRYRRACSWIRKRFWDQYDYKYYYKRVRVCRRVYY